VKPPKNSLDFTKQVDKNVADVKGDLAIPTTRYHPETPRGKGAATDATRVAAPEKRIPTASERLRTELAEKDKPVSKTARASRQVAANKLADEVRKSRK
jgi:hypothetical protein